MRKQLSTKTQMIHMIEITWRETKKGKEIQNEEQAEIIAAIDGTYFICSSSLAVWDRRQGG